MLVTSDSNPAFIIHVIFTIICPFYIPFGLLYYTNKIYITCTITDTCGESGAYMTPEIIILFVVLLLDIPVYYLLLRVVDTVKLGGKWQEALWMSVSTIADTVMIMAGDILNSHQSNGRAHVCLQSIMLLPHSSLEQLIYS